MRHRHTTTAERRTPSRPREAPEGLLLFVLLVALLVTLASVILAYSPAASMFAPLEAAQKIAR